MHKKLLPGILSAAWQSLHQHGVSAEPIVIIIIIVINVTLCHCITVVMGVRKPI